MTAFAALATAAGLTAAELLCRQLLPNHPKVNRLDPLFGWRPRPGLSFHYAHRRAPPITINAAGFRDVDHAMAKPPGTVRIAILGDSVVESREVALSEIFWKRLETAGDPVEVVNFGVNGYSTAQSLLLMQHQVDAYSPDLVIHVFYPATDVSSNLRVLGGNRDRPYFSLADGRLDLDSRPGDMPGYAWRTRQDRIRSATYDLRLAQLFRNARLGLSRWARRRRQGDGKPAIGRDHGIYRQPDETWETAWSLSEAMIGEMARLARLRGAGFLLVILPNPVQVHSDAGARAYLHQALGIDSLDYPERRLAAFAAGSGLPCLTLLPAFLDAAADGTPLFVDGVHLNETGHRLAAAELRGAVQKLRSAGTPERACAVSDIPTSRPVHHK